MNADHIPGLSPLAVTALKIGDLPSSSLVGVEGVSLLGGSLHRSQSSTSLTDLDTKLFGGRGQQGSGFNFGAFPSSHGSRTPPPPPPPPPPPLPPSRFTSIPSRLSPGPPHHYSHQSHQAHHHQPPQQPHQSHQSSPGKVCSLRVTR